MNVLLIHPEIRLDDKPFDFPFWAGIFASIVEQKGGQVAILDLNALRMNNGGNYLSSNFIKKELLLADWDLIGIGGLTTMYSRLKQLIPFIRKICPNSTIITGGGWATYNPDEILKLVPDIDMICIGEGEETFSEVYDQIKNGTRDFENVKGLCLRDKNEIKFTEPRALIPNLDVVPYPNYDLFEMDIYFRYSSYPYSKEAFNSKKRATAVWERGCPRGCTFCSHNGMSRIDLQNIYGKGDRIEGEKIVRITDKANDTFQLPARWPSPKYAVDNVKLLKEKFDIDFLSILDENMTSNRKWTQEFCDLYIKEGLAESVKWGTLGDAPSVATNPDLLKTMKDAGCSYISFGFESASNKVLKVDIQKGQTQMHLQKTIDEIKKINLRPLTTFMIGNPHEDINDLLETVTFWIKNNIEVDPFICTPYVGSPIYFNNKDFVLQQYDERLKFAQNNPSIEKSTIDEWKFNALDKFMKECGDATLYTATISKYFTIPELIALKRFMYKHDTRRMLQMAHQRYEQTGLEQWNHDEQWNKICPVCIAKDEVSLKISSN
ncbi:B12-binding domain-containing radical SAM protein [Candidatus Nitrosopumilus sp. SW]|uniref:B12-binding domain-containing radical SAM protein n=1 Tax=Candidatus Nitrosopumilus sp. SW TaxID=2508726 RepID=UPI001150F7B9|nr:radical SAM protein [Candidatus Nitrosopumilus sp. SW]QDI88786.1 B12-binding domain-containing radical SAM protein [Candidatus Nitrosopumilus sp. SW]